MRGKNELEDIMERKDKLNMAYSAEDLTKMLRDMAESLERGRLNLGGLDLFWGDVLKISLSIKNMGKIAQVKMKVDSDPKTAPAKAASPEAESRAGTVDKPRGYGALKKRMKKSFKNIVSKLHKHAWPEAQDVDDFIRDSALMVQYPGKGDEFYAAYSEAVAGFAAAIEAQDLKTATQKARLLNDLKTRCHKLYD
jgi:XXXCH domain-containing protein